MKNKKTKSSKKPKKMKSIKSKVSIMTILGILISVTITLVVLIGYVKELVIDSSYGKMLNTITSYGKIIDIEEQKVQPPVNTTSKPVSLDKDKYKELLKDFSIEGTDSCTYYVVNKSGIVEYHCDETMIKKPIANSVISDVLGKVARGVIPENSCLEYEQNGEKFYASYYITEIKSLVVVCSSGDELMKPIKEMVIISIITTLILMFAAIILCNIITSKFTKPLLQVTNIIDDTSNLKLKIPDNMDKLCARNDETGMISRAVKKMSISLHEVVSKIEEANSNIKENMNKLENSSNEIHMLCTDNSSTTEQLAAGTEEATSTTKLMNKHMSNMKEKSEFINNETKKSNETTEEVSLRAKNMQVSTTEAIEKTKNMYEQISQKTKMAIEGLRSVSKINELTKVISEISDQTNLLSLNASIEAARAGDAGRGFSVVANEIGNLAKRSIDTVEDINNIIKEVNTAVKNISSSLEETSKFLDETVLVDYDNFKQISEQYLIDADGFQEGMTSISKEITELNNSIREVSDAVESINRTIEETSVGVTNISEKTLNVVNHTSDNHTLTNNTVGSVEELEKIIKRFNFD